MIETIQETKLLGVMLDNALTWDKNTAFTVKRAKARMRLLHKLVKFDVSVDDLILIYILYIRSVLDHSSVPFKNLTDIERVQKNALQIILKDDYISYEP